MSVFQLLYASGAVPGTTSADIAEILAQSRANNARLGITGMLLYANSTFIQVLEGEETNVRKLAALIGNDRRHRNFMILLETNAPARAFARWQMGFKALAADEMQDAAIFATTRQAVENRIAATDGRLILDAVFAFAGPEFLLP